MPMLRPGSASATAIAARRPAPPPPTMTTSCDALMILSGTADLERVFGVLVREHLVPATVAYRLGGNRAVVIFVTDQAAAAFEIQVVDDEADGVVIPVTRTTDDLAAWGRLGIKRGASANHF